MRPFDLRDWYWIVAGDDTRAWSSALSCYTTQYPVDATTHVHTEAEVREVLRRVGLRGPGADPRDVKAEAQRRIIAVTGAVDLQACLIKQLNALMRERELTNRKASGGEWTAEEAAEAAAIEALAATIKLIRARSNELEAMSPIPDDYDQELRSVALRLLARGTLAGRP